MLIIIDGYNLIFAIRGLRDDQSRFDPNLQREKLLELLIAYRKRNPVKIHAVFDGKRTDYRSTLTKTVGGIVCSYSGPGETADELIMEMLEESHSPKSILLVTGDRRIRDVARRRRAKISTSDQFAVEIFRVLARKRKSEPREKYTGLSKSEADQWMKMMGFDDDGN